MRLWCIYKKEKKILIVKEIPKGPVEKSNMRKGFLIYDEMRKFLIIFVEALSYIWLYNCSLLDFLINEENFLLFFISVVFDCPGAENPRSHRIPDFSSPRKVVFTVEHFKDKIWKVG